MTVSVIREAGAKVLVLNRPAVGAVCLGGVDRDVVVGFLTRA